jgi:DNA-binding transcriptional regulator YiaG
MEDITSSILAEISLNMSFRMLRKNCSVSIRGLRNLCFQRIRKRNGISQYLKSRLQIMKLNVKTVEGWEVGLFVINAMG